MLTQSVQDVIKDIRDAWRQGRGIVPLLGSGFSAEAGVPTIEGVLHYLALLRGYVREKAYLPILPDGAGASRSEVVAGLVANADRYGEDLSLFVRDFGWPDPYHLRQDFGKWLSEQTPRREPDEEIVRHLNELTALLYPEQLTQLGKVRRDAEAAAVAGLAPRAVGSALWKSLGRWPDLVHHFTGGDSAYARGLFERLRRGYRPGLSHRFLAFLARLLSIRLFLTTTFDDLLEEALRAEEVDHTVFVMEGGRRFPSAGLVRDTTAVVKMEGDLHNILLGGPMYLPLEEPCLDEFYSSLPHDPLLLVIGHSGRDRRVLDLVRRVVAGPAGGGPSVVWLHYERTPPRPVTQLDLPEPTSYRFARVTHPGLFLSHLYSVLTSRHPSGPTPYPAHAQRPIGLQPRGAIPEEEKGPTDRLGVRVYLNSQRNCYLFSSLPPKRAKAPPTAPDASERKVSPTAPNASERMAAFVNDLSTYTPIWIDLEGQYTLAGVIGSIIDQCRTYDQLLTPSVLPLQEGGEKPKGKGGSTPPSQEGKEDPDLIQKGASRVLDALCRGRYVLALDALEAYTWRHTVHHGDLEGDGEESKSDRQSLIKFLTTLLDKAEELHGSLICVSVGEPEGRRSESDAGEDRDQLLKEQDKLTEALKQPKLKQAREQPETWLYPYVARGPGPNCETDVVLVAPDIEAPLPGDPDWQEEGRDRLALLCLSCFRRTRNLVALRTVLGHLVKPAGDDPADLPRLTDGVIDWFCGAQYLLRIAGGGLWMNRALRDRIYSANSAFTRGDEIRGHVSTLAGDRPPEAEKLIRTIQQCLLLSAHHDRIAHYYYFDNYVQSNDSFAFFEHVYHRVSSIRYLTKIVLLRALTGARHAGLWQKVSKACEELFGKVPAEHLDVGEKGVAGLLDAKTDDLKSRWRGEIRSLRLTWKRSRTALLRTVPAEQIISWCRWLIVDDLPRFYTRKYREGSETIPKPLEALDDVDAFIHPDVEGLGDDLYDLWAQSCRDRSDYDQCIRLRLRQQVLTTLPEGSRPGDYAERWRECLKATGQEKTPAKKLARAADEMAQWLFTKLTRAGDEAVRVAETLLPGQRPEDKGRPGLMEQRLWDLRFQQAAEWWLDIAECLSAREWRGAFRRKAPAPREGDLLDWIEGRLEVLPREEGPTKSDADDPETASRRQLLQRFRLRRQLRADYQKTRELLVRCQLIRAEARLRAVSFWGPGYLYEASRGVGPTFGDPAYTECRKALVELRQHGPDAGPDYFEHRALFLTARARARMLRSAPPFLDAYRDLELARSLPRATDPLLRAGADLVCAELALIEADDLMALQAGLRDNRPPAAPTRELLDKARAKLDSARGYLQRLPKQLLAARRNTVGWKSFFQLIAQYQSERNLWGLARVICRLREAADEARANGRGPASVLHTRDALSFMRRLRGALVAIRRGLDRDLDPLQPDPWLLQAWRELFFGSVLFARLAVHLRLRPLTEASDNLCDIAGPYVRGENPWDGDVFVAWRSLNRSSGLLVGGEWEDDGLDNMAHLTEFWNVYASETLRKEVYPEAQAVPDGTAATPSETKAPGAKGRREEAPGSKTGLLLRHWVGQLAHEDKLRENDPHVRALKSLVQYQR